MTVHCGRSSVAARGRTSRRSIRSSVRPTSTQLPSKMCAAGQPLSERCSTTSRRQQPRSGSARRHRSLPGSAPGSGRLALAADPATPAATTGARPSFLQVAAAHPGLVVAVGAFLAVLVRIWLADKIATPWIMVDELIYSDLARSFADSGKLLMRGTDLSIYSVGYPLLISPAWLSGSIESAYVVAKA